MTPLQPELCAPAAASERAVRRRGMLAAAAAFVVGLIAKRSEEPVFAGTDGDVVLGASNSTYGITSIASSTGNGTGMQVGASIGLNNQGARVVWQLSRRVWGDETVPLNVISTGGIAGAGVFGESNRANSAGVWGSNAHGGIGVRGDSDTSSGVFGQSTNGVPVFAQVTPGSSANTMGVYALNTSTYTGASPGAGGF